MSTASRPSALDETEVDDRLLRLRGWTKEDGAITRTLEFRNFSEAKSFVDRVAELAEQAQHHPDIHIRYDKVTFTLRTHSAGGLTENDFAMAERIDRLALDR
jgi:4a-hydroxytetrahydrobiopterin dehydratase